MIKCIWCGFETTNKISLANHYDNLHRQENRPKLYPSEIPTKEENI